MGQDTAALKEGGRYNLQRVELDYVKVYYEDYIGRSLHMDREFPECRAL